NQLSYEPVKVHRRRPLLSNEPSLAPKKRTDKKATSSLLVACQARLATDSVKLQGFGTTELLSSSSTIVSSSRSRMGRDRCPFRRGSFSGLPRGVKPVSHFFATLLRADT